MEPLRVIDQREGPEYEINSRVPMSAALAMVVDRARAYARNPDARQPAVSCPRRATAQLSLAYRVSLDTYMLVREKPLS